MPNSEELTSKEIEEVRELLRQQGLNTELPKMKTHRLPENEELFGGFLRRLGVVGQYIAWTYNKGKRIVKVLLARLLPFFRSLGGLSEGEK